MQIVPPVMMIRTLDSGYCEGMTEAEEAIVRRLPVTFVNLCSLDRLSLGRTEFATRDTGLTL